MRYPGSGFVFAYGTTTRRQNFFAAPTGSV
jgi:hypothetical protein